MTSIKIALWCMLHTILSVISGGLYFVILLLVWYLKEEA